MKTKILLTMLVFCATGFGSLLSSPTAFAAYDVNKSPRNVKSVVVGKEKECTDRLATANASGGAARNRVNNSGPYENHFWISRAGDPTDSGDITATYGATSFNLQVNGLEFICAILVKNNSGSSYVTDAGSIVDNGTFPRDRAPNPDNGDINSASLFQFNSRIKSVSVVGGGGVSGLAAGNKLHRARDSGSRYWYTPENTFTYNAGSSLITDREITIKLMVQNINTYHALPGSPGAVSQCTNSSGGIVNFGSGAIADSDYSACEAVPVDMKIKLNVPGRAYVDGLKMSTTGAYDTVPSMGIASPSRPFSDNTISANRASDGSYYHGTSSNPVYFKDCPAVGPGCSSVYDTSLPGGIAFDFLSTDRGRPDSGWRKVGYTICNETANGSGYCGSFISNPANKRTAPVTLVNDNTYRLRYFYEPGPTNTPPKGSLALTCQPGGSVNAQATFSDIDGATDAYIRYGLTNTPKRTTSPTTWTGLPDSTTLRLFVDDIGGGGYVQVDSATITCPPPSGVPCPLDPTVSASKDQPINPTGQNKPSDNSGNGRTSGYSNSPGVDTGQIYSYDGTYRINSVKDQYNQDATSFTTGRKSSGFSADYTKWVDDYPYDIHNVTAKYTSYYNEDVYKSTTTPTYYCSSPYSYSGGKCTYTYTAYGTYTCTKDCGKPTEAGTCTPSGSPTSCAYSVTDDTGTVYVHYAISYDRTNKDLEASEASVGMHTLNQCFYRQFDVHSMTEPTASQVTAATMSPDNEDPDRASFAADVYLDFKPHPSESGHVGLRKLNRVRLDWTAQFYYMPWGTPGEERANGLALPVSCSPADPTSGTVTIQTSSGSPGSYAFTNNERGSMSTGCNARYLPPLNVGDRVCVEFTVSPDVGEIDESGSGNRMSGSGFNSIYRCSGPLVNRPYAHFFEGDVAGGGQFANGLNGCTGSAARGITGFIKNPGSSLTRGMSGQFAGLGEGPITGYGSASVRPSSPFPTATSGLSFANAGVPGAGYLNTNPCITDYFNTRLLASTTNPGGDGSLINPSTKQAYLYNGDMTLPGLNVANGASIALYVNGDLAITGPIDFQGKNSGWPTIQDIPSLFIIVRGNIYIDSSVTNLDGVFIAQPGAGGGSGFIDTCANATSYSSLSPDNLLTACQSQLTVNGSFIAENIKLRRSYASVRNSMGGERFNGGSSDCRANGGPGGGRTSSDINYDCAAEIFYLTPETYLGIPMVPQESGPATGKYDYITTLQPVL